MTYRSLIIGGLAGALLMPWAGASAQTALVPASTEQRIAADIDAAVALAERNARDELRCVFQATVEPLIQELNANPNFGGDIEVTNVRTDGHSVEADVNLTVRMDSGEMVRSTRPVRVDMAALQRATPGARPMRAAAVARAHPDALTNAVAGTVGTMIRTDVVPAVQRQQAAAASEAAPAAQTEVTRRYQAAVVGLSGLADAFQQRSRAAPAAPTETRVAAATPPAGAAATAGGLSW